METLTLCLWFLQVENLGPNVESRIHLAFPTHQARNIAELIAFYRGGKSKLSPEILQVDLVNPQETPRDLTLYSVHLKNPLNAGERLTLELLTVLTHSLKPFPEQISQTESHLVMFQDSAYFLSPYSVKFQTLSIILPSKNVESFTKVGNSRIIDSKITYGSFENLPAFSYSPIAVHFESKGPFSVAQELIREIEVSHWGNIQVTEHYKLLHSGALNKGGFSRS